MTAYMCPFLCKIKLFCGGGGELWHRLLLLEENERKCVCVCVFHYFGCIMGKYNSVNDHIFPEKNLAFRTVNPGFLSDK